MKVKLILLNLFLIITLFIGSISGQSKEFFKLQKHYSSENFDKVIKKADKYRQKNSRGNASYYFLSLAYVEKYKESHYESYLKQSISNLKKAKNRDKNLDTWKILREELVMIETELGVKVTALSLSNKPRSRKLCQSYIELFGDTLECYTVLFTPKPVLKDEINVIDENLLLQANNKRDSIKAFAASLIGVPYVWAGETPKGFDCSGFVLYVYKQVGVKLPHKANKISYLGHEVSQRDAKTGDVILFGTKNGEKHNAYHAGIVYENDKGEIQVIHCISKGVHVSTDFNLYWKNRVMMITNILDDEDMGVLSQNSNRSN